VADEFRSWALPGYPFDALLASARFEELGKGRRGTVLVDADGDATPIVRTTTHYQAPAQPFLDIHHRLARDIGAPFNNALIEHYTDAYPTMKHHSDQALDLADKSSIAIYSCYRDPARPSRRLTVKAKADGAAFDIPLAHGSVVAFSLDTNRRFTHTIALAARGNDWLGVTFRVSKTFVRVVDGQPCLATGVRLTLATEDERREFFQLRRRENEETNFTYPAIAYTISASDLQPPR
jgi:hypothetical protein